MAGLRQGGNSVFGNFYRCGPAKVGIRRRGEWAAVRATAKRYANNIKDRSIAYQKEKGKPPLREIMAEWSSVSHCIWRP
jgi:hypothetical protein